MNVLVTGATGVIGHQAVPACSRPGTTWRGWLARPAADPRHPQPGRCRHRHRRRGLRAGSGLGTSLSKRGGRDGRRLAPSIGNLHEPSGRRPRRDQEAGLSGHRSRISSVRLTIGYAVMVAALAATLLGSFTLGSRLEPVPNAAGVHRLDPRAPCLRGQIHVPRASGGRSRCRSRAGSPTSPESAARAGAWSFMAADSPARLAAQTGPPLPSWPPWPARPATARSAGRSAATDSTPPSSATILNRRSLWSGRANR